MTDIDFDELDRAVSSLMNKQQEKESSIASEVDKESSVFAEDKSAKESVVNDSFAPPVTPFSSSSNSTSTSSVLSSTQLISQAESKKESLDSNIQHKEDNGSVNKEGSASSVGITSGAAANEAKTSPIIAKRPTGRFMDVVRPSSSNGTQKPVISAPSRTGLSIQPSTDLVDVVSVGSKSSKPEVNIHSVNTESGVFESTPDLKDVHDESVFYEIENASIEEVSLTDRIAQSLAVDNSETSAAPIDIPLESPFIANVEVEKRPLGSTGQAAADPEVDIDENTPVSDDSEKMKLEHQYNANLSNYSMDESSLNNTSDLTMDLSPEIIAIEESGVPESAGINEEMISDVDGSLIESSELPEKEAMDSELTPMFDAVSTEVKPSAGKEKKKSGLLIALLIVLFLAIGMAGGAVSYFLLIK